MDPAASATKAPANAVLCGKVPHHVEYMVKNLMPKIEIVHVCMTADAAVAEIPTLLQGNPITPSSGYGTNADHNAIKTDVKLIIVGGGWPEEERQTILKTIEANRPVPVFVADTSKTQPGAGPPSTDAIKKRILDSVEAAEKGDGEWVPGVYSF
ncbi:hypothetical protein ABEF95_003163 [Exophiala dermatitidis]